MRVSISYPPVSSERGVPLLSQNRQFQWFHSPTYVYPIIPAYAATMLKEEGHEVAWHDGIAEEWTAERYLEELERFRPDLVMIETKTPVVKQHWRLVDRIKELLPDTLTALVGDHVTALPLESMEQSRTDYVLTGGDYDFLVANLCAHIEEGVQMEKGIWFRTEGGAETTGPFELRHDLGELPPIDRELTKWRLYSTMNGNFKRKPGTYTMAGRDCWWHRCTFCSWTTLYPKFRARSPESLVEEIGTLIERYRVKEIFDDTGTFPVGNWLRRFCDLMIESGHGDKVSFSCNMRVGGVRPEQYREMKEAGFRMLLFGVESGAQSTLDRICKGGTVEGAVESCRQAKAAGLEPHITMMFGYPWETEEEVERSVEVGRRLMKKGFADTLQATIVVPYPGTPLFEECRREGLLRSLDWDEYDMRGSVLRTQVGDERLSELIRGMYKVAFDPEFVARKIVGIRSYDDLKFIVSSARKVVGHIRDFSA